MMSLEQLNDILNRLQAICKRIEHLEENVEKLAIIPSPSSHLTPLDVMALLELPEDAHAVAMILLQLSEATEDEIIVRTEKPRELVLEALQTLMRYHYAGCRKKGNKTSYFVAETNDCV